ncbi:MAG: hypothetical protein ACKVIO_06420, partial [Phycisphaerales bacterium]
MAVPAKEKKRRLGKGLQSLLAKTVDVAAPEPGDLPNSKTINAVGGGNIGEAPEGGGLVYLDVHAIRP